MTRLIGALAIGAVAGFLASDRLAPAIPDRRARIADVLALAFVPTAAPNACDGR